MSEKKRIKSVLEFKKEQNKEPMELYKPSTIPVERKLLVMRSTAEDLLTKGGVIIDSSVSKTLSNVFYVVAKSEDSAFAGLNLGDEVIPFMPPGAEIQFQVIKEIINDKEIEFGVFYDAELAGYRKPTREIKWMN